MRPTSHLTAHKASPRKHFPLPPTENRTTTDLTSQNGAAHDGAAIAQECGIMSNTMNMPVKSCLGCRPANSDVHLLFRAALQPGRTALREQSAMQAADRASNSIGVKR